MATKAHPTSRVMELDDVHSVLPKDTEASSHAQNGTTPEGNFLQGLIIITSADAISFHPLAEQLRRDEAHVKLLTESLRDDGQREPVVYRRLPNGSIQIVEGVTRTRALFGMGKEVSARELTERDLAGRSLPEYILAVNFSEGRQLIDRQRAITVVESMDELIAASRKRAEERMISGKRVPEAEKDSVTKSLSVIANVSESLINEILKLKNKGADKAVFDALWSNKIATSVAKKIVALGSQALRDKAMGLVASGNKQELKRLLSTPKATRANGMTISPDPWMVPILESKAKTGEALKCMNAAVDALREASAASDLIERLTMLIENVRDESPEDFCEWCRKPKMENERDECPRCHGKGYRTHREVEGSKLELQGVLHKVG